MSFQSKCQSCVALTQRDLKPGQVLRVYYKSSAIIDKDSTKFVRYTVSSFLQNNDRMLKLMGMTMVSPCTPEKGMISTDQMVYHNQNMRRQLSGTAPQVVIPNFKEAPAITKDG